MTSCVKFLPALLILIIAVKCVGGEPAKPVPKKGLAGNVSDEQMKLLKIGWFYKWTPRFPESVPAGIEFIPMVWGVKDDPSLDGTTTKLTEKKKAGASNTLLGFNEPDDKNQSNMTVEAALEKWPKLMETGLRLGSPSGVHADSAWMVEFMKEAEKRKLRVDFITVHWYGTAEPGPFLAHLAKVHKLYNRPIWITEFAVADWNATEAKPVKYTQQQVVKFMERLLPQLNKLDYVERYSWFNCKTKSAKMGTSALFNEDGSLTEVGKVYSTY